MASLQSLKAPTLMSKKTQKTVQAEEDEDVIIDANALPSRVAEDDVAMDESGSEKPNFAPASASELSVRTMNYQHEGHVTYIFY